jgi:DNA-binding Xre family transcriptional regulator
VREGCGQLLWVRLFSPRFLGSLQFQGAAPMISHLMSSLAQRARATCVDLAALERICTVLGCGLGELLEIVPDEPPQHDNVPFAGAT